MSGLSDKNTGLRSSLTDEFAAITLKSIFSSISKKPYYDLHELLNVYTFAEVIDIYSKSYPYNDLMGTLKSLSNFNDVELAEENDGLNPRDWDEIKDKISVEIKDYVRLLQLKATEKQ